MGTFPRKCCPWNRFAEPSDEAAFVAREGLDGASLIEWMTMTQEEAWALGRIATEAARQALRGRVEVEEDGWVREEIAVALEKASGPHDI